LGHLTGVYFFKIWNGCVYLRNPWGKKIINKLKTDLKKPKNVGKEFGLEDRGED